MVDKNNCRPRLEVARAQVSGKILFSTLTVAGISHLDAKA